MILDEEELPLMNPYHMGGEPLATPPGFHFFTSILILFTGMSLLFAQLLTAAFFSAFIVFPAFLISKKIWKTPNAGVLAAFFAAVSALSLEMISWGGYTNVVSLAIIVIIFCIFLKEIDQPSHFNLLMGTMLFGSLILTHTFSLFVFSPILIVYFVSLLISKVLKPKEIKLQKPLRFFTVSVALGILIVSPWLLRVLNFYMGASSEGVLLGGLEQNKNLILANRSIDNIILTLVIVLIPTFFMFKASRKRYVDNGSLLLVAWFLVPLIMTQSHIFGVFVDYSRFMYFIDFPGILIMSAGLFYLFRIILIALSIIPRIRGSWVKEIVPAIFTASLFAFIVLSPWSIFPNETMERVNFYTTIQRPEATALEWIRNRTPESSVLVADHLYGWWLSGIGKRTTLSAAGLEFLLYSHEIEVAKSAQLLLDTDYYIDNGLIHVRDDGPYIPRHNPVFSIKTWSGEPYSLVYFQENETIFYYDRIGTYGTITLSDMKVIKTSMLKDENSTILTITRENDLLKVKETLKVQRGIRFAELSYEIKTKDAQTSVFDIEFAVHTVEGNITKKSWMVGVYDPHQRVCGQVIFREDFPEVVEEHPNPRRAEIRYRFSWKPTKKIKFFISVFEAEDLSYPDEVEETYYELSGNLQETVSLDPLITWDYHEMIERYNVSFVLCRDYRIFPKFSEDPKFRLVFKGGNVAIFQVVK